MKPRKNKKDIIFIDYCRFVVREINFFKERVRGVHMKKGRERERERERERAICSLVEGERDT